MSDICVHCSHELRGWAAVPEGPVCHSDTGPDCYRLVTVYKHPTPCSCDGRLRYHEAPSIPADILNTIREMELTYPIAPPNDPPTERPHEAHWVCDSCMMPVTRKQIAEMADGEHVICTACMRREHERR